jgi:hypothetical protein
MTMSDVLYETWLQGFVDCENQAFETLIKCIFIFYRNLDKVLKKFRVRVSRF